MSGALAKQTAKGFTLVELLVVITVIAMVATVMPFAYQQLSASMSYKNTVNEFTVGLKQTRLKAIKTGSIQRFQVDLEKRTYQWAQQSATALPDSLAFRLYTAASPEQSSQVGQITFYPDGSANGGSIEIQRPSGQGVRLRVDWMLGRVTQEPLLEEG